MPEFISKEEIENRKFRRTCEEGTIIKFGSLTDDELEKRFDKLVDFWVAERQRELEEEGTGSISKTGSIEKIEVRP